LFAFNRALAELQPATTAIREGQPDVRRAGLRKRATPYVHSARLRQINAVAAVTP
jgi:hypothetical protein